MTPLRDLARRLDRMALRRAAEAQGLTGGARADAMADIDALNEAAHELNIRAGREARERLGRVA